MPTYTITELSREFDVTPRAIRFYEDQGLLYPRRQGLARVYGQRDRTRLKLTLRGKRLGLTLAEIKELVDMYDSPRDTGPQLRRFLAVLAQHRVTLERQLADLQETLAEIGAHEAECRRMLARFGAAEAAVATGAAPGAAPVKAPPRARRSRAAA